MGYLDSLNITVRTDAERVRRSHTARILVTRTLQDGRRRALPQEAGKCFDENSHEL